MARRSRRPNGTPRTSARSSGAPAHAGPGRQAARFARVRRETLEQLVRERVLCGRRARPPDGQRRAPAARAAEQPAVRRTASGPTAARHRRRTGDAAGARTHRRDVRGRPAAGPGAAPGHAAITGTALPPAPRAELALDALLQRREVQVLRFDAKERLAGRSTPTDADIEAFYKANEAQFRAPEQAGDRIRGARHQGARAGHCRARERTAQVLRRERRRYTRPRSGAPATS